MDDARCGGHEELPVDRLVTVAVLGEGSHHLGAVIDRRSHAHMIGSAIEVTQGGTRQSRGARRPKRHHAYAGGSKSLRYVRRYPFATSSSALRIAARPPPDPEREVCSTNARRPAGEPVVREESLHPLVGALYLENRLERAGEPGHHVLPIKRLFRGEEPLSAVVTVDAAHAMLGIDHPDESDAGGEPVGDVRQHLAGPVAWGQDFYDQVRSEIGKAGRLGIRQAVTPD